MKIDLLPALNGDCVLVENVPSHYFLIDGGYVDTYKDYLLPKLKEISENGGAIDGKQSLWTVLHTSLKIITFVPEF